MKADQIEPLLNALAEIIDSWNDAQYDGDRGRGNNAITLTVYDDGSGRIGARRSHDDQVEDLYDFNDAAQLADILEQEGVE